MHTIVLVAMAAFSITDSVTVVNPDDLTRPTTAAAHRDGEIRVDGWVDEPAWLKALPASQFVQGTPVEGAPAEQRTEVRVVFDGAALYVAAVLYESDPDRIADQLVRRDEQGQYDYFELSLDPNSDRRTGYQFRVSAAGVQRDVYLYDDVRDDEAWDAVWESAVRRGPDGWSIEMRIPLSQIRYTSSDQVQSWGINFSRRRVAANEVTYFALESRIRHGKVSVFGQLDGLTLPRAAQRIELRPYTLASLETAPAQAGNPFFDGSATGTRAGLDLRYGLGAAFTVDLSLNPDFGQVEADPAVVNLTAFETFFPEKRPFFVEDAQVFNFSLSGRQNSLFYSRRIGGEPHGSSPDGYEFDQIPSQTTILGAAKLTGRTSGGLSMGALVALTPRETGRAFDNDAGRIDEFVAEPRNGFGIVRLVQDLRGGASQVGAILTATNRGLPADGTFDFLPSNAYSLGVDFEHNWGGARSRNWAIQGFFAGSLVQGMPEAMLSIQRSPNHYFQRPDATRFSLDSTATSISGLMWRVQFERRSAEHWTGGVWLSQLTPGFEVNDLGFSTSGERLDAGARLSYQEITPGPLFRSYRFSAFSFNNWRHEALDDVFSAASWQRAMKSGTLSLQANLEFLNYWRAELTTRYSPQTMSDVATRGGPLMIDPGSVTYGIQVNTDRRKWVFLEPQLNYTDGQQGESQVRTGIELQVRPSSTVEIGIHPSFTSQRVAAQYVSQTEDAAFEATNGRRYLFADLERRSFSFETRLGLTFSPKLTFQLFAQPLVSSGDYLAYKQLSRSASFDFDAFKEGLAVAASDGSVSCQGGRICLSDDRRYVDFDGDGTTDFDFSERRFNLRSLRMTAVLRWEYRPGSTLFLVWGQSRSDWATDGSFDISRDLGALWNADTENTFIVKLNYWIGL